MKPRLTKGVEEMNVWNSSSSESKNCVVCGKKTSTYKVYEQSSIAIKIPACHNSCYYKVDVGEFADISIKLIKKAIKVDA